MIQYFIVCVCLTSNADDIDPREKQAKLDDSGDLSGGLTSMLKSKVTEVRVIILFKFQLHTSYRDSVENSSVFSLVRMCWRHNNYEY